MTRLVGKQSKVYKKSYKINIKTLSSEFIEETISYEYNANNNRVYKVPEGFILESSSKRIGEGYADGVYAVKNILIKDSYLLNQERGVSNNSRYNKLERLGVLTPKLDIFLRDFAPYMKIVSKDYESDKDKFLKYKVTDTEVIFSEDPSYNDDSVDGIFLGIEFNQERETVRLSNKLRLTLQDLIHTPSGFYNVFPRSTRQTVSKFNTGKSVLIQSNQFLRLDSSHLIKMNGWLTDYSFTYTDSTMKLDIDSDCLSPISGLRSIDRTNEYLLYELVDTNYKPIAILSQEGVETSEEVQKILNSHEEFLRPYKVLPKYVNILLETDPLTEDSVFKIEFEEFDKIRDKAVQELNIPNININNL